MSTIILAFRNTTFSFDKWILFTVVMLLAAGLVMNLMATSNRLYDTGSIGDSPSYAKYKVDIYAKFRSHLIKVVAGLAFAAVCYVMPVDAWRKAKLPAIGIAISLVLFALVHFFGENVNGARRWLRVGGFQISPSDVARFALILWLSDFLTKKKDQLHHPINLVKAGLVVALIAIPIILQPNLSTVMIIAAIAGAMLWVSGIPRKWVYTAIVCLGLFGTLYVAGTGFRHSRSQVFLDPFAANEKYERIAAINPDAAPVTLKETSYQQRQSIIAMVQGGITGVGFGTGRQKYFLPEAYNDCIVAIIGEEWGLIGISIVLLLLAILTWRGFRVTYNAPDQFRYLLAFGIIMNFLTYFFIHFFVNVSAMPSTGVPFPFISHGGTAMVFNLGLAAILLRISCEAKCPLYPK